MKRYILIFIVALLPGVLPASDTLTLLFTGDVMMHQMQIDAAKTASGYVLDEYFEYIVPQLSAPDLTVANLEVTLSGAPHSGYPAFSAPDELPAALQRAGVDILLTANNHSCDKGKRGVERTLRVLDSLQFLHTGTFYDRQQRDSLYPLLVRKNGIAIALLNYTYGTNGIPVPAPTVVNLIDTVQIAADIEKAKSLAPDIIIAAMHWGEEYRLYPNKEQRALADFLLRRGVRLVIGSHPHVLQGMELQYAADTTVESAVVYSLGNFISNQTADNTEIGAMASIRLIKSEDRIKIDHAGYTFTWVYKPVTDARRHFHVLPAARFEEDASFFNNNQNYKRMRKFLDAMRSLYSKVNIGFTEEN